MSVFKKPGTELASQDARQILKLQREDWVLFRTVEGLQRRAGVPKAWLRRLVLKELADNGLDNNAHVRVGKNGAGGYYVEDDGSGIDPDDVAGLCSIARPMVSTKFLRLPTRGALGNGLRVVAGAVLASQGSLVVITRNRRITLRPERHGSTTVLSMEPVDFPVGTRVEISAARNCPTIPIHSVGREPPSTSRACPMRAELHLGGMTKLTSMNCYLQAAPGRYVISWPASMAALEQRRARSWCVPDFPGPSAKASRAPSPTSS